MAMIELLKPVILAAGFLFLLVGLNIMMVEYPNYNEAVGWLYSLILYTFYLYLVLVFIGLLVMALNYLKSARLNQKSHT